MCEYPIYQHVNCSYKSNMCISNRFLTTRLFQIDLDTCLVDFISIILGTHWKDCSQMQYTFVESLHYEC